LNRILDWKYGGLTTLGLIAFAIIFICINQGTSLAQGDMDLDGYCKSQGYTGVALVENTAYGWRCEDANGSLYDLDLNQLCSMQFGNGSTPEYSDFNNAYSWKCTASSNNSQQTNGSSSSGDSNTSRDCNISSFTHEPSSNTVSLGTEVYLSGTSNCGTVRFEINGTPKAEIGQPNQTETWKTNEFGTGTFNVCFVARGNGGWENADRWCNDITVGNQSNSASGSDSAGMDILGWCHSIGYSGADFTGDAYSWSCTKDGSQPKSIDVDSVCRYTHGDNLPYAGLGNQNDPYSWFCSDTPQDRPSETPIEDEEEDNKTSPESGSSSGSSGSGSGNTSEEPSSGETGDRDGVTYIQGEGSCDNALDPKMVVDGRGRVTINGGGPTALLTQPGGRVIEQVPEGGEFDVIEGPLCENGYFWWTVRRDNGNIGVMAEGRKGDDYWIEPINNSETSPDQSSNNNSWITKNGRVCNDSSITIWVLVSPPKDVAGDFRNHQINPGNCIDNANSDVDAIWGKVCNDDGCTLQAWKVAANKFTVIDELLSPTPSTPSLLSITGSPFELTARFFIGDQIPREWLEVQPEIELDMLDYELAR
jgi:hypothetical protein